MDTAVEQPFRVLAEHTNNYNPVMLYKNQKYPHFRGCRKNGVTVLPEL